MNKQEALKAIAELEIDCIDAVNDMDIYARAIGKLTDLTAYVGGVSGIIEVDAIVQGHYGRPAMRDKRNVQFEN